MHDPGKIVADLVMALALGGDCLADVAVLRAQPGLAGPVASNPVASNPVASDPVVSRLVTALAAEAPRALRAICTARAAARERAWALAADRAPGAVGPLIPVDIDATIVTAHSPARSRTSRGSACWLNYRDCFPMSADSSSLAPLRSRIMVEQDESRRDLAALIVARVGSLRATGDPWEPYVLADPSGTAVQPVAIYLRDLQAAGRAETTLRSYGMDLLCWFRFCWAADVSWSQVTRAEARDFSRWVQIADKPAGVSQRARVCRGSGPVTDALGSGRAGCAESGDGKAGAGTEVRRGDRCA